MLFPSVSVNLAIRLEFGCFAIEAAIAFGIWERRGPEGTATFVG